MITFLSCLALLVGAYFIYGGYLARLCRVDDRNPVPSKTSFDGVDYLPLPLWMIAAYLYRSRRVVLITFLPAFIMTYICMSYIFISPLMFGMQNRPAAYLLGGAATLAVGIAAILKIVKDAKSNA